MRLRKNLLQTFAYTGYHRGFLMNYSNKFEEEKKKKSEEESVSRTVILNKILEKLNRVGNFSASILAADSGLIMAEAGSENGKETITMAAMSSLAHATASRIQDLLKMGKLKDIVIQAKENMVVFKTIRVDNHIFILGILAPQSAKIDENLLRKVEDKIMEIFG